MEFATRWHLMPHPPLIHTISWLPNQPCASSSLGITMTTPPEGQRVTCWKRPQKRRGQWKVSTTFEVFQILWRFGFWCYYFHAMVFGLGVFFSFLWLHSSKLRMAARVDNVDRLMANCSVLASGHGVFLNRLLFSENIFVKCFNGSWESYFEFQE